MTEHISVTPKILELQDNNDIYMTLTIRILSAEPNLNLAEFSEDFILNTVKEKESFIGIPFVVDKEALENGEFEDLTHKLTSDGELKTDQIGSFVDFWADRDEDETLYLAGSIRVMKRFKKTTEAIKTLHLQNNLSTSCEVSVHSYEEVSEDGVRKIHYNDGKNRLFASCIVTSPADTKAKSSVLVAEAYKKDINSQQGGGKVSKTKDKIETFNKGINIAIHGKFELAELKIDELYHKIYNVVNPVDSENGGRDLNFLIRDLYTDSVVFEDWDDFKTLYKAKYTVDGETVTLADREDWVKGSYGFIPENVSINELMEQNSEKITSLETELNELKEEKETMAKQKELTVEELNEKIEGLEKEIASLKETNTELEETIVSQKEEAVKATETAEELNGQIKELTKYKDQVEKAEKEAKTAELNEKFSKLLSEETFKSEEVQNAIAELNESDLNSIVVSEMAKEKVETASTEEEIVEVSASKQGNLIEETILQKYNLG